MPEEEEALTSFRPTVSDAYRWFAGQAVIEVRK